MDAADDVWDNEIGDKRPDNVPGCAQGLCLFTDCCVWDFGSEEIWNGGTAHLETQKSVSNVQYALFMAAVLTL